MIKHIYYILLILAFGEYKLFSQHVTFFGQIIDTQKLIPISNTEIEIENSGEKYFAGKDGKFSFYISSSDTIRIQIKAQGYLLYKEKVIIPSGIIKFERNFYLHPDTTGLKEYNLKAVFVTGRRIKEITLPTYEIKTEKLLELPVLSEPDIFRAAQILPSVARGNDFSSGLIIRGASHYQHQILLDGTPVFNTFHFGGLTSIFNTDILEEADLYPSCYPPEFGGVSSSIFNVKTKNRYSGKMELKGLISLLTSSVTYSDKIGSGILTLSGRRTYLDFITQLIGDKMPNYYYDLYGKYKFILDSNNIISGSVFYSHDFFDIISFKDDHYIYSGEQIIPQWGNFIPSIRWEYFPSQDDYIVLKIYSSLYSVRTAAARYWKSTEKAADFFNINNSISQTGISGKYGFKIKKSGFLIGFDYYNQNLDYNWEIESQVFENQISPVEEIFFDFAPSVYNNTSSRTIASLYAQVKLALSEKYSLNAGGRFEYPSDKKIYSFNPYFNFTYSPWNFIRLSFSYGRYNQMLVTYDDRKSNSIYNGIYQVVFFPDINDNPRAEHYTINAKITEILPGLNFNTEGYLIQREEIPFILYTDRNKYKYSENTFGYEMMFNYDGEEYDGIISYSWAKSIRKEGDSRFPGSYDQRHLLKLFYTQTLSEDWNISLEFYLSTGMPYSMPTHFFLGAGFSEPNSNNFPELPNIGELPSLFPNYINRYRNNERSPLYHRLDFTFTYKFSLWGMKMNSFFTIINLFNKKNPIYYGIEKGPLRKLKYLDGIPLIPLVGVSFEK